MGIKGLMPVINPICDRKRVSDFAGQRVGIDMSCWLHKAAFSCATELATGVPTRRYIDTCLTRLRMLLHAGVVPILVFDGAPLPMKAPTNTARRAARDRAHELGMEALKRKDKAAAFDHFSKGVRVTHEMSRAVIKEVRKLNVEYVVAPYEADAQLAFLSNCGEVDVIFTEDSDLVVYGGKKIFYKMNRDGEGDLFVQKNLMALDKPSMRNFTPAMLTTVCVLSGCDFLPEGVPGLGIHKAHALVKRHRTNALVMRTVKFDNKYKVGPDFADQFYRSLLVFGHQTVFDKATGKNIHLKALDAAARALIPDSIFRLSPEEPEDLSFIGRCHDDFIAAGVADATIHPITLESYADSLDIIERSLPTAGSRRPTSVTGMRGFLSSVRAKEAATTPSAEVPKTGGMVGSQARGGGARTTRHQGQGPATRNGIFSRPVSAGDNFFDCRQNTPTAVGHSSAVAKKFKIPKRTGTAESAAGWAASLKGLDPGDINRGVKNGKRQRTMLEMSQVPPSSAKRQRGGVSNRFADLGKKTGVIRPMMQPKKSAPKVNANKRYVQEDSTPVDVREGTGTGMDVPSSPDSAAYERFEELDKTRGNQRGESQAAEDRTHEPTVARRLDSLTSPVLAVTKQTDSDPISSAEEVMSPLSERPIYQLPRSQSRRSAGARPRNAMQPRVTALPRSGMAVQSTSTVQPRVRTVAETPHARKNVAGNQKAGAVVRAKSSAGSQSKGAILEPRARTQGDARDVTVASIDRFRRTQSVRGRVITRDA